MRRELSGQPGDRLGTAIVPSRGRIDLHILSDCLHIYQKVAFGLETKTSYLPFQHINGLEIAYSRFWWLLWICVPNFLLFGASDGKNVLSGILFIGTLIAFFVVQPRYLAIYSSHLTPILFFQTKDSANVERFSQTLLAIVPPGRVANARQAQAAPSRPAAAPTANPRERRP